MTTWSGKLPGDDGSELTVTLTGTPPQVMSYSVSSPVKPVSYWKSLFDNAEAYNRGVNTPRSTSTDSQNYYDLAYTIDANVSMFEATGATRYLDQALLYVNNVIDRAKPSTQLGAGAFRDSYSGWVSQRSDVKGQEVPLFESYMWRYVTRMLRVMHDDQDLYADPTYRAQYDRVLAFTETNIFDKWLARGANSYVYRSRTHMAAHWAFISFDLARLTSSATRRTKALAVVDNIDLHLPNYPGSSLHGQMKLGRVKPGAYWWSDVWGATTRPGQDVDHGNGVLAYVVEARDLGSVTWTAADVAALGKTLTDCVLPKFAYVDGTGTGTGWIADGFVKLGRYAVAVQQRLENHTVQGQEQYMAAMAVNAKTLGA